MNEQPDKFIGDYSFSNECIMPFYSFKKFYELYKFGEEGRRKNFIENGLKAFKNIKPDITVEEYIKYMNNGNIPEYFFVGKPIYLYKSVMYYMDINNCKIEYDKAKEQFFETFKIDEKSFFDSEEFDIYI